MESQILSLNIGAPEEMFWNGKSVVSSMNKRPVEGPLHVSETSIDGDSFANPKNHGTPDNVLYAFGLASIEKFLKLLGRDLSSYRYGAIGETLTVDDLDEEEISVGDIFEIGEVLAQATWPRIPCAKVNYRIEHEKGQAALFACGVSGVYFRILRPGRIHRTDSLIRLEEARTRYTIYEVYAKALTRTYTAEDLARARKNGAFPERQIADWDARLKR